MEKISKKQLKEFLSKIATVGESKIPEDDGKVYYSKIDGSYLTRVGMEDSIKFLLRKGISEEISSGYGEPTTANIGYNPIQKKWYGWSHRAIFGFGIGSDCKKGDSHYRASNKEDFAKSVLEFYSEPEYSIGDEKYEFGKGLNYEETEEVDGVYIAYTYNNKVPNKKIRGTEFTHFVQFPKEWGKGEWVAKTLEEAKQMAIDFAKSVS